MFFAFDMDGTLADTRPVVRDAYLKAGVVMPDYAWGLTWRLWLVDYFDGDEVAALRAHKIKSSAYQIMLGREPQRIKILPPAYVLGTLLPFEGNQVSVLTGASEKCAIAVMQAIGFSRPGLLEATGMKPEAKAERLNALSPVGIYVDDNRDALATIAETCDWRLIHYTNQTATQLVKLMNELTEGVTLEH